MKSKKNFNAKNPWVILATIFVIILIFAFFDFLFHLLKAEYSVPSYYFRNKIIFGTLIGIVAYYFTRKMKLITKSLIFSLAASILLQMRYAIEGYAPDFVILFMFIHFGILLVVSYFAFKIMKI